MCHTGEDLLDKESVQSDDVTLCMMM
jgi:hypothetical protein